MPRHNSVQRLMDGKVKIVIDNVAHTLSEAAFIELMYGAFRVLQNIEQQKGT